MNLKILLISMVSPQPGEQFRRLKQGDRYFYTHTVSIRGRVETQLEYNSIAAEFN